MASVEVKYMVDGDGKEMVDLLGEIIQYAKDKKEMNDYLALMPKLMSAVDGYQNAINAAKGDGRNELITYASSMLMDKFAPDDEPEVSEEPSPSEEPSTPA